MGRIVKVLLSLVVVALVALFAAFGALDKSSAELRPLYGDGASQFLLLPSGATVHYRDQGKADGPAIVLIHGSNASLHTWEPWVKQLGDTYRIVTLDLPGHGLTGTHEGDDYSRAGQVAFVKEFVASIGLSDFVLGGNSMGGGVTLQYAVSHGEDLRGIIPVSSGGMPRDPNAKSPLAFRLASMPVISTAMRYILPRSVVEDGLKHSIEDDALVTQEMVDRYYDLTLYDGNRDATRKRFSGYASSGPDTLKDDLANVNLPALILWGANDPLIPVANAHLMVDALPNAKLVIYENVGHIAMEEVPEQSAADVRAFMESLDGA
ncbi:MAG: alpha/beta hydrolase [Parvibaculum sp.]